MRIYKRIAIVATIFLLIATLNVYAATTGIILKPSVEKVKIGDTITITIAAKCNRGIEGLESTLEYDKTKLELITEAGNTALNGYMDISGIDEVTKKYRPSALYSGSGNAPTEVELITLGFKVLNTATVGETLAIGLTDIEIGDSDNKWEKMEELEVILNVVAENNNNNENDSSTDDNNNNNEDDSSTDDNNNNEDNSNTDDNNNNNEDESNTDKNNNSNEDNNSNKENNQYEHSSSNAEKDDTTSKIEIPKAGKKGIIIIAVALGIILAITIQKTKKYKDIY